MCSGPDVTAAPPAFALHIGGALESLTGHAWELSELKAARADEPDPALSEKVWHSLLVLLVRIDLQGRSGDEAWSTCVGQSVNKQLTSTGYGPSHEVVKTIKQQLRRQWPHYTRWLLRLLGEVPDRPRGPLIVLWWTIAVSGALERVKRHKWLRCHEEAAAHPHGLSLPPWGQDTSQLPFHARPPCESRGTKLETNPDAVTATHRLMQLYGRVRRLLRAETLLLQQRDALRERLKGLRHGDRKDEVCVTVLTERPLTAVEYRITRKQDGYEAVLSAMRDASAAASDVGVALPYERLFWRWIGSGIIGGREAASRAAKSQDAHEAVPMMSGAEDTVNDEELGALFCQVDVLPKSRVTSWPAIQIDDTKLKQLRSHHKSVLMRLTELSQGFHRLRLLEVPTRKSSRLHRAVQVHGTKAKEG